MTDNKELRKCSRCHATKLTEYFSINAKGELYKTCCNCIEKRNTDDTEWNVNNKDKLSEYAIKAYEKVCTKPLEEQYLKCEKCGNKVHRLNEGMSRHLKRWSCVKTSMPGEPGKKEFYEWVLANKLTNLKDYNKYIKEAEEYLNQKLG